jgi:hypothetical protein
VFALLVLPFSTLLSVLLYLFVLLFVLSAVFLFVMDLALGCFYLCLDIVVGLLVVGLLCACMLFGCLVDFPLVLLSFLELPLYAHEHWPEVPWKQTLYFHGKSWR